MTLLAIHADPLRDAPSSSRTTTSGLLYLYDRVPYASAWELQRTLHEERVNDQRPDTLLLLEHDPVYTLGRSTKVAHWSGDEASLKAEGCAVYHANRGGSITYHGPGQVVGYPILRVRDHCSGPKSYMRLLEEVTIRTLAEWGIVGRRLEQLTGVWVEQESPAKIAALGVHISRGVAMHGFALNVSIDLTPFSRIIPCGLPNCRVTSMADILGDSVPMSQVKSALAKHFADVFRIEWTETTGPGFNPAQTEHAGASSTDRLRLPVES